MSDRTPQGQFAPGNPGGPGRPPKARELAYLAVLREAVSLDDGAPVVARAKADAVSAGYGEGEGATRDKARRFLADYLLGRPAQTLHLDRGDDDVSDQYDGYTADELHAIIAAAESGAGAGDPAAAG